MPVIRLYKLFFLLSSVGQIKNRNLKDFEANPPNVWITGTEFEINNGQYSVRTTYNKDRLL